MIWNFGCFGFTTTQLVGDHFSNPQGRRLAESEACTDVLALFPAFMFQWAVTMCGGHCHHTLPLQPLGSPQVGWLRWQHAPSYLSSWLFWRSGQSFAQSPVTHWRPGWVSMLVSIPVSMLVSTLVSMLQSLHQSLHCSLWTSLYCGESCKHTPATAYLALDYLLVSPLQRISRCLAVLPSDRFVAATQASNFQFNLQWNRAYRTLLLGVAGSVLCGWCRQEVIPREIGNRMICISEHVRNCVHSCIRRSDCSNVLLRWNRL